jgi:RHS repeat-associated protein
MLIQRQGGVRPSRRARAWLVATSILASGVAVPALAQTSPPPRQVIDERGVDVASGQALVTSPSINIADLGFAENWTGSDIGSVLRNVMSVSTSNALVILNNVTKHFIPDGVGGWVAKDGDGSTLVQVGGGYRYTSSDGTKYDFVDLSGPPPVAGPRIFLDQITRPDGTVLTYSYRIEDETCGRPNCRAPRHIRAQSVVSSRGYMLKPTYAAQNILDPQEFLRLVSVTALDQTEEACNPAADTCVLIKAWPKQTWGSNGTGTTITDEAGKVITVESDANGVTNVTQPDGTGDDTEITYDGSGRVATITRSGVTYNYSYSLAGGVLTTTVAGPDGSTEVFATDTASQRPSSVTNRTGDSVSYQYDASGRKTRETMPEGNYTQWTYDTRGNVTEVRKVAKSGSGLADIVETANFDASCANMVTCNKPNYTIDARGKRTDFTYSAAHGGVTRIQLPGPASGQPRPEINYTYTALTPLASSTPVYKVTAITMCATAATCAGTANETKITLAYNTPNLNLSSKTVAAGDGSISATESYAYDWRDRLVSVDGPLAGSEDTSFHLWEAPDRLAGKIGPDPDGTGTLKRRATRYTYDAQGRVKKEERGTVTGTDHVALSTMTVAEQVEYQFDLSGNVIMQTLGAGGITYAVQQMSYDNRGRLECTAVRMNNAVFGSLPSSACTLGVAGLFGPDRITKTFYDAADRVTKIQTGLGVSGVQSDEITVTYSANAQVATVTDGESNKTTYEYDGFDRLAKTRYPVITKGLATSSTTDYEELAHDAASNVVNRRLRDGASIAFSYDDLNRLTQKNLPGSEPDVSYNYDLFGRLIGTSTAGHTLTFTFDALGRNLSQSSPLGTVSNQYDSAGRRTRVTHPGGGLYADYDYLVTGEVSVIRENGATSGAGVLATFGYDDLGRRESLTRGNGTVTNYSYDAVSRLASITQNLADSSHDVTTTFTYDAASGTASRSRDNDVYAFSGFANTNKADISNGLNQITTTGGVNLNHDARGNVSAIGTNSFAYSSENLLQSGPSGTTLAYDPMLRLYEVNQGTSTRFLYDGVSLIGEYDASGTPLARYIHGPGMDEALVRYEGTGTGLRRWLHADERGSIVATSDESGSSIITNRYDEYGNPASGNSGRFQYTGQAWLPEIGMYYYKARIYNPAIGRFQQPDPIGYSGGPNVYAYVGGDPVNNSDPSGTLSIASNGCAVVTGSRIPKCGDALVGALGDVGIYAYVDKSKKGGILEMAGRGNPGDIHDPFAFPYAHVTPDDADEVVVNGVRAAIISLFPSIGESWLNNNISPLNENFAEIKDLKAIRDSRWKKRPSSHSPSAWEIALPGTSYVLKLYQNDTENRGLNTIAIVAPTGTMKHWIQFPLFTKQAPVNYWNAADYCRSTKRC